MDTIPFYTQQPTADLMHAIATSHEGYQQLNTAMDAVHALIFRAKNAVVLETVQKNVHGKKTFTAEVVDCWSTGRRTTDSTLSQVMLSVLPSTVLTQDSQTLFSVFQHFRMDLGLHAMRRQDMLTERIASDWNNTDRWLLSQLHGRTLKRRRPNVIQFKDQNPPYALYSALCGEEPSERSVRGIRLEEAVSGLYGAEMESTLSMAYLVLDACGLVMPYHLSAMRYIQDYTTEHPDMAVRSLWLRVLHASLVMDAARHVDTVYEDTPPVWKAELVRQYLPTVEGYADIVRQMDKLLFVPR